MLRPDTVGFLLSVARFMNLFCISLLVAACVTLRSEEKPTNYLSIYLLADTLRREAVFNGTASLTNLTLEALPILTDHDFVSYNTNTDEAVLNAEAAKRIVRKLSGHAFIQGSQYEVVWPRASGQMGLGYDLIVPDTPFVVKAMNERVYFGAFTSFASSRRMTCLSVTSEEAFISYNSTNGVAFFVSPGPRVSEKAAPKGDPRFDPRIVMAVERLCHSTNAASNKP
jgi:hypothetical protein